jgi:hypothetical protein
VAKVLRFTDHGSRFTVSSQLAYPALELAEQAPALEVLLGIAPSTIATASPCFLR